ncbi:MAG TPA: antibiotic biosynthesis monooxygenase, partial [Candidatus Acidoferrum sp.]|nr:antibiotic biosynthesis monooxygenase [Candidatus Acidoferrum sp.]
MNAANLKDPNHIVRIDRFKVPAAAREEFLARVRTSNDVLRSLPGFVEDCFLEGRDASGNSKIVTIAIWENQQA